MKGNGIDVGDEVQCNALYFIVEEFKIMKDNTEMVCGEYGCFNARIVEKIKKKVISN